MRTTIDLDDELLRTAKNIAEVRGQSLSKVISDLAWKGLRPDPARGETRNGFPVLPVRPGAHAVTPEHVTELLHLDDAVLHPEDLDAGEVGR
jgi:hypothetical protein